MLLVTLVGVVMGFLVISLGKPLLGLYTSEAEAIAYGLIRMKIIPQGCMDIYNF